MIVGDEAFLLKDYNYILQHFLDKICPVRKVFSVIGLVELGALLKLLLEILAAI